MSKENEPRYEYKELIFDPDDNRLAMLKSTTHVLEARSLANSQTLVD